MRELPITFNAKLLPLVMDGQKTVTRRLDQKYSVGDRLYVRENFRLVKGADVWKGPLPKDQKPDGWTIEYQVDAADPLRVNWRPSIHCPKWAARLWLEVVDVRREPIQSIDEADAQAEGIAIVSDWGGMFWTGGTWTDDRMPTFDPSRMFTGWKGRFACLWDQYATTGSYFFQNPEVTRVAFRKV